jgi:hypothetical protein
MDFGLIAMILVAAKIVLDYVAPRTKNKVDDKAKQIVDKANEVAPLVKPLFQAAPDAAALAKAADNPPVPVAGFKVRDHR